MAWRGGLDDPLLERLQQALEPEFELDGRLAAGGMGIVFRAREVALDRQVAIKVLRPELATAVARERFLQEARLLARLQHPNIVPVHRADERDGLPFYVMDFIEGQTLADRLAAGPFPLADLTRLGHDLLRALAAAHGAGIIHRDVKPHNIFFVRGRALLGDFGIARDETHDDRELTGEGSLLGTRGYMSPEQLRGEPATERSDQYSGAAVLYQAACGRPWKAIAAPSSADWRGVPGPMASVLKRALAADPAERWPSMDAVRRAFDRKKNGRRRLLLAGVGVAALLVAGAVVRALLPPRKSGNHRSIAVLPFAAFGGSDDSLGLNVSAATDINLAYFPQLSRASYPRSAAWQQTHPMDGPAAARQALDVDRVVTGLIEARENTLTLTLTITDSTGSTPLPAIEVNSTSQSSDLGRLAALAIGTQVSGRPVGDARNLASRNPEAALVFFRGEALFDDDEWESAAESFLAASRLDTTFVLSRWRMVVARVWARQYSWEDVAQLAACCADQLPPLESGLVRAMAEPNLVRRFAAFDALAAAYSDVSPFLLLYASEQFHRGPLLGRDLSVSLDRFEGAVQTSQGGVPFPAYDHLVWGKTRLGARDAARGWLAERQRLNARATVKSPIVAFLQLGYDIRWVPWRARAKLWYLEHFSDAEDLRLLARFFRFSATFDAPEGQDKVGAILASRLLSTDRASGLEARGLAHLTWGQVSPGLAYIDSAAALFKTPEATLQRHQWRLMLPVLGAGRAGEAEEASARRWLVAEATGGAHPDRATWTLALDALRRGDTATAATLVSALARLGIADSSTAHLARLATAILQGADDPRAALTSSAELLGWDSPIPGHDIFARSLLHLSRARWFEATDRPDEALREILWYENSDTYGFPTGEAQKMEVDAVASVAARVDHARLLLTAGERDRACRMLTRVRELWHDADASLTAARERMESLHTEGCR